MINRLPQSLYINSKNAIGFFLKQTIRRGQRIYLSVFTVAHLSSLATSGWKGTASFPSMTFLRAILIEFCEGNTPGPYSPESNTSRRMPRLERATSPSWNGMCTSTWSARNALAGVEGRKRLTTVFFKWARRPFAVNTSPTR